MSEGNISPHEAGELAMCFSAHARDLFGYACALTRGDRALAGDLVQTVFETAGQAWQIPKSLADEQRRDWLRRTLASAAIEEFRRETAASGPLPRVDAPGRTIPAAAEQACSPSALKRSWRIIQGLPERQHVVALLRWQMDMKEDEIAAALGMAAKVVSANLYQVRSTLLAQLGPDHGPGDDRADRETGSSPEDVLLSRLYQQVTELAEPGFRTGYDIGPALDRFRSWLGRSAADGSCDGHLEAGLLEAGHPQWGADRAVTQLYSAEYRKLVRLAVLLVRDTGTAEEVVQDAFVAMHDGWHRLKDADKALAYLRQAVVNKARSVLRHRMVVDKNMQEAPPDMPSAEHGAFVLLERHAVVAALRDLPERQREAIVLRYYADLSEAEIAETMGISRGAVKSHTSRGMTALRAALERE